MNTINSKQHQITRTNEMYILVGSVNQELNAMALHHWKYGGDVDDMVLSHHVDSTSYMVVLLGVCMLWLLPKISIVVELWLPSLDTHVAVSTPLRSFSWASHFHGNDFWLVFNTISTNIQSFSSLVESERAKDRRKNQNKTKKRRCQRKIEMVTK